MHLDVLALKNFYYRSSLGRSVQRELRGRMADIWTDAPDMTVVGFGFAVPLLRPFMKKSRRVIALMPGPQGVMPWPAGEANHAVLCEETLWPMQAGQVDRLVVMHGLETSEHPTALLEECWRVLAPSGRAIFIVPNRGGLWSRSDRTPFGFGRPYTLGQLESQLAKHRFVPERTAAALYQPSSEARFWRKTAGIWERLGRTLPAVIAGGVLMVEVSKQVAAPTRPGLPVAVKKPLDVLDGLRAGVPEPSRVR